MGVDEVALDLLQDQKQRDKAQRLQGVVDQNENRAHDAAHPRADDRDQRRHRDEHADEQHIGHAQQRHGHKEHAAQDARLQALARDEAGKRALAEVRHRKRLFDPAGLEVGAHEVFHLGAQALLGGEKVDGEHHREKEAQYVLIHRADDRGGKRRALEQEVDHVGDLGVHLADGGHGEAGVEHLGDAEAVGLDQLVQALERCGNGLDDRQDGVDQLRHHDGHDDVHHPHHQRQHQHHRHRPPRPAQAGRPVHEKQNPPLQKAHGHVEHEGQNAAQEKGHQDAPQGQHQPRERAAALKKKINADDERGQQQDGQEFTALQSHRLPCASFPYHTTSGRAEEGRFLHAGEIGYALFIFPGWFVHFCLL